MWRRTEDDSFDATCFSRLSFSPHRLDSSRPRTSSPLLTSSTPSTARQAMKPYKPRRRVRRPRRHRTKKTVRTTRSPQKCKSCSRSHLRRGRQEAVGEVRCAGLEGRSLRDLSLIRCRRHVAPLVTLTSLVGPCARPPVPCARHSSCDRLYHCMLWLVLRAMASNVAHW